MMLSNRPPPPLLQMAGQGGTVSRKANKKLTKLYWPSRKRLPKRLIVLLEPKSVGARPKIIFRCLPPSPLSNSFRRHCLARQCCCTVCTTFRWYCMSNCTLYTANFAAATSLSPGYNLPIPPPRVAIYPGCSLDTPSSVHLLMSCLHCLLFWRRAPSGDDERTRLDSDQL